VIFFAQIFYHQRHHIDEVHFHCRRFFVISALKFVFND
jgi:hypothetical protein